MKKHIYILLIIGSFLFPSNYLLAQNLVPNASFEYYEDLPMICHNGGLELASPWFSWGSADYIHIDMPLQLFNDDTYEFSTPKSGRAYSRFIMYQYEPDNHFVEPIEVQLKEPMQVGETYQVSYYIQKTQRCYVEGGCQVGADHLGIYFHTDTVYLRTFEGIYDDPYKLENYLEYFSLDYVNEFGSNVYDFEDFLVEPRVELNQLITSEEEWVLVTDTVFANKPFEYMVFSRFLLRDEIVFGEVDDDCEGTDLTAIFATYHVDDVSVHLIDEPHIEADAGEDATICLGDSIQIGTTEYEDYMYFWTPNEDMPLNIYGHTNPGMPWVKPTETTTYSLTQKDFAFEQTTDEVTITVEVCPDFDISEFLREQTKIYPNPAKDFIEIESIESIASWKLIDALGKEVKSSKLKVESSFTLGVSGLDAGLYFLELEVGGAMVVKQVLVK